jgi:pimeloyl-ACP methyl ester carboxylesterase
MKFFYKLSVIICLLCCVLSNKSLAQVQSPRYIAINNNCNGFYEYLPQGYETGNETYPLMVFIHGIGELGNGSTDLPKVLQNGPPRLINFGLFPTSFTVNNTTHKFIIISPQYVNYPVAADAAAVINYAVQTYRVNPNRIYLTGLSMGGGVSAAYAGASSINANKLAAVVTVCGAEQLTVPQAATVANANLPFWGTHNSIDGTVHPNNTINNVANINSTIPAPVPAAKITIFPVASSNHDAWTQTYDPNFRENGLSIYEWMLSYQRNVASVLPIVLQEFKANKTGEKAITLSWKTSSEENAAYFLLERSEDGINYKTLGNVSATNAPTGSTYSYTDNDAIVGDNFYRLSEVDKQGKKTIYKVIQLSITPKTAGIRVYPNPVISSITLENDKAEKGPLQVLITDIRGSIVKTWLFNNQNSNWKQTLDISFLTAGNYIIKVKGIKTDENIKITKR